YGLFPGGQIALLFVHCAVDLAMQPRQRTRFFERKIEPRQRNPRYAAQRRHAHELHVFRFSGKPPREHWLEMAAGAAAVVEELDDLYLAAGRYGMRRDRLVIDTLHQSASHRRVPHERAEQRGD